jgi:hypothetical protein
MAGGKAPSVALPPDLPIRDSERELGKRRYASLSLSIATSSATAGNKLTR